jgi:hypothetical protein
MSDLSSRPILAAEVPVRKSKSGNRQRTAVPGEDGSGQQRVQQRAGVMDESSGSGTSRSALAARSPNHDPDAGMDDERELKYGASHVIKLVSRFRYVLMSWDSFFQ